MFSTMTSFVIFFFIGLAVICIGILNEDKLIHFEDWILSKVKRVFGK